MNLGIGLGVTNYLRVPTVALDPDAAIAALFASGEVGAWYDPSDSSTVWQDAAGTTPAGVGDPVGRIDDKSGNGNHATQSTSAARPVLQQSGDLYYLDFDGVDDFIATSSFAASLPQPNTFGFGYKEDVTTSKTIIDHNYIDAQFNPTTRHLFRNNNGTLQFYAGIVVAAGQSSTTSDTIAVLHFNTIDSTTRFDGVVKTTGVNVGFYTWGSLHIGSTYVPSNHLNGRIYSFVGIDRTLTAAEITDLETYLAAKSGVTLP